MRNEHNDSDASEKDFDESSGEENEGVDCNTEGTTQKTK